MTMRLPPGSSWLRVDFLSPANLGAGAGSAAVDRPLPLAEWTGLPYIPFSALKGVLAARYGEPSLDPRTAGSHSRRESLFGAPYSRGANDSSYLGSVVLGDGEIFAFPLPLETRGAAWVVPLSTLRRLRIVGELFTSPFPQSDDQRLAYTLLSRPELPKVDVETDAAPSFADLRATVAAMVGCEEGRLVLAAPEAARRLWRCSRETRTLTALQAGAKRVSQGSLRTVELIPAGTSFVALATNHSPGEVDLILPRVLQLGAWEATGCGFARIGLLESPPPSATSDPIGIADAGTVAEPPPMLRAFEAVRAAPDEIRPELRSLLRGLAARLEMHGFRRTLAFSLAKARPFSPKPSAERAAHRWLLAAILGDHAPLHEVAVAALSAPDAPADLEPLCLWLGRYAETLAQAADATHGGHSE